MIIHRHDMARIFHRRQAAFSHERFRLTHALLEARARSISLRFKWRIEVSAPAIAGASEVVKMKPGA